MVKQRIRKFLVISFAVMAVLFVAVLAAAYLIAGRAPGIADRSTLVLRIGGTLVETPPDDVVGQVVGGSGAQTVRSYVDALRKAARDPRISSVLIVPTGLDLPYWAKVQELREAILEFRKSGKRAIAYLEYGGDREYYLGTACDRVYLMPGSPLDLTGVASYEIFLRGTLDKIGAVPDFLRIGDYKTAPNQLTERTFTPTHREMSAALNRDVYDQLVAGIAESRRKPIEDVRALLDEGPFVPDAALRAGLVDGLAYEDQLDDTNAFEGSFAPVEAADYGRVTLRSLGLNRGPRIAVIYMAGVITSGSGGYDPINGEVAGSDTIVKAIRAVRADPKVRAIVLRIDSPGGSASASDVIWRELVITRDARPDRPLVASMSDFAASGGYYLAMAAPQIVAQPATLTGSIGIFGGKIALGGTYEKLGANIEALSVGRNAEINSPDRPYSESERAKVAEQIRAFYDQFIAKVAVARRMQRAAVVSVAEGRVWTGQQARERGLVDALGGLDRAIALAKTRAGIAADQEVEIVSYPPRRSLYELLVEQLTGRTTVYGSQGFAAFLGVADRRALGLLTAPLRLFRRGEPLALMPTAFLR